jgi:Kef-type K+ transport system membrane component KefB
MNHSDLINLLLAISVMLLMGRLFGEFFRKIRVPLVVGELIAGILLGPSILGQVYPQYTETIFTTNGNVGLVLNGLATVSVIMLLFAAGMEVELTVIRQQSKVALKTSFVGLTVTLTIAYFAGSLIYPFLGLGTKANELTFKLFFAVAMGITALPIIARTLMDLNLFKTKVGMIIIAAAMLDDIIGWLLFSVVLGMMNAGFASHKLIYTLGYTLTFAIFILTIGRALFNKALPWAQRNLSWPGGVLAFSLGFAFLGAAFTEKIGIHAIFGAFIVGIAIGDSVHLNEKTRDIIHQFITNIFAPLFFVSIGFKVNFITNFDGLLTLLVIGIAIITKLVGSGLGAMWGGLKIKEAIAVGFGMNARGAMEIVLGLLALQAGLINEQLFVALVVMAVLTSIIAGPMLKYLLTGEMKVGSAIKEIIPGMKE